MRLRPVGHGAVGGMKGAQSSVLSPMLCRRATWTWPWPGAVEQRAPSPHLLGQLTWSCPSLPALHGRPSLPPQVLIVVPFREAALRVVQLFISLLEGDSKKQIIVSNKKRFNGEYGSDPEERPPNLKRPEDYEAVFVGNIDDHFRIGNSSLSELRPRSTEVEVHTAGGRELGVLSEGPCRNQGAFEMSCCQGRVSPG